MEHIVSFIDKFTTDHHPFLIQMAGITYPDATYHIVRNHSSIYCLEYVLEGSGTLHVDSQTFYPTKGDIYILPKGCNHNYYSSPSEPFKKIWMNVHGPLCDSLMHLYHMDGIVLVKQFNLYHLFQKFLDICENKDLNLDAIHSECAFVFHQIISEISQHVVKSISTNGNVPAKQLMEYINRHIYQHITMEQLSHVVNLSTSQINRIFKKEFKVTPYDYILNQKIETAKLLLCSTNLSIQEIAYRLNFCDEHYFSNLFKQKTGIRPSQYSHHA